MNTKKIILDSAFALLQERPFKKVSVQDILTRANVSRSTFYHYFPDKYEVMWLYYKEYINKYCVEQFNGSNWEECLQVCFDFVLERNDYFMNIKDVHGQNSFWDFLYTYCEEFYKNILLHNTGNTDITEEESYQLTFITNGVVAFFKQYVEGNKTHDSKRMSHILYELIPDIFKKYISLS